MFRFVDHTGGTSRLCSVLEHTARSVDATLVVAKQTLQLLKQHNAQEEEGRERTLAEKKEERELTLAEKKEERVLTLAERLNLLTTGIYGPL